MTIFESIFQGIIQGLTEFLPVSSSGHIHIIHGVFGIDDNLPLFFVIILHLFTLLAVLIVFRKEIIKIIIGFFKGLLKKDYNEDFKMGLYIIIATIPTGIIGLAFEDIFEKHLSKPLLVSAFLFITGLMLFISKYFKEGEEELNYKKAIIIGIVQGLAITPGISRSGSTISTAIFLKVKRETAGVFSFLLSIPAILGATILKFKEFTTLESGIIKISLIGGLFAFVFGLFSLIFLVKLIKKGKFYIFSYYCFALSISSFIYFLVK